MPATHLTSVDLPAPLSPTRAMTSPLRTSKSTPRRACTAPNRLCTPRSSSSGVSLNASRSFQEVGGAPRRAAPPPWVAGLGDPRRRAVLGVLALADVAGLQEAVLDDGVLDVVLGDRDGGQQDGGRALALVLRAVVGRGLLALGQRDGELGGRVGLLLDRLVDRHALLAGEDVLDALGRGVLPGDRLLAELAGVERRDDRVGQAVVRRQHAVALVARLLEHLLEDRKRLLVVPLGHRLVRALRELAGAVERIEHAVVAVGEQRRVVVRRRAVELGDGGLARAAKALDEALALELADRLVVERDVVVGAAAQRQAVVVDDLRATGVGGVDDGRARTRIEVDEQDDLRAVGQRLVGLAALGGGIALRIDDGVGNTGGLEGLVEIAPVLGLPADRGLRVGQQDGDLVGLGSTGRAAAAAAGARRVVVVAAAGGHSDRRDGADAERQRFGEPH